MSKVRNYSVKTASAMGFSAAWKVNWRQQANALIDYALGSLRRLVPARGWVGLISRACSIDVRAGGQGPADSIAVAPGGAHLSQNQSVALAVLVQLLLNL